MKRLKKDMSMRSKRQPSNTSTGRSVCLDYSHSTATNLPLSEIIYRIYAPKLDRDKNIAKKK
jgi:hypothetical protein